MQRPRPTAQASGRCPGSPETKKAARKAAFLLPAARLRPIRPHPAVISGACPCPRIGRYNRFAYLQQKRHIIPEQFQHVAEISRKIRGLRCQSNYLQFDEFCGLAPAVPPCFSPPAAGSKPPDRGDGGESPPEARPGHRPAVLKQCARFRFPPVQAPYPARGIRFPRTGEPLGKHQGQGRSSD